MNISENIKNFIQNHSKEINNNDFSPIYSNINYSYSLDYTETGILTKLFLLSGINPLDYMTWVPSNFLRAVEGINTINIPNNIEEIDNYAFYSSSLKFIKLPSNLLSMGDFCFANSDISSIEIPSKVSIIGMGAFQQCSNLKKVVFKTNDFFKLSPHMFSNCFNLTEVKLPDNLTGVSYNCFNDCTGLINISLPSTITQIDEKAFMRCINLEQINIPSLVAEYLAIDSNVFIGCDKLTIVNFGGTMAEWKNKIALGAQNKEITQQCTIKCVDGNLKYSYDIHNWGEI